MRLHFTIKFVSGFHLGSGKGSSDLDGLLMRESNGPESPVIIKGTSIVGALRQSLYDLLQLAPFEKDRKCQRSGLKIRHAYCTGRPTEQCPICRILGTPEQEKKWYFSNGSAASNLPPQKVTRTSIDRETRTSKDRKLFSYEIGGKDMEFLFTAEHDRSTMDVLKDAAYIVAGFRFIRFLGSSKRRGKGACIISLDRIEPDTEQENVQSWFLDILKQLNTSMEIDDVSLEQSKPKISVESSDYVIELVADEPILITQNMGAGNLYSSLHHIPGQTLRGAFAWKAIRRGILETEEGKSIFKDMFERNKFHVSEFYPDLDRCEKAAIPAPMTMLRCEFRPYEHDVSHKQESSSKCRSCEKEGIHSKMERIDGYISPSTECFELDPSHDMHIAIEQAKGVVERGALYEYASIPKGTRFLGIAHLEPDTFSKFLQHLQDDVTIDKEKIKICLQIGKATSRGYGKAHLTLTPKIGASRIFTWEPIEKRITSSVEPIIMNFISDTILRDKYGRYYNGISETLLEYLIGYETKITRQTVRTKHIDRFDAHSGLPRWREIAIIAGSAVEFTLVDVEKTKPEEIRNKLKEIEDRGLGLNSSSGYGIICSNHPVMNIQRLRKGQESESQLEKPVELADLTSLGKKDKKCMVAIARLLYTGKWGLHELEGKLKEIEKEKQENLVNILKEMIQKIEARKGKKKTIHELAEYICSVCEGGT